MVNHFPKTVYLKGVFRNKHFFYELVIERSVPIVTSKITTLV